VKLIAISGGNSEIDSIILTPTVAVEDDTWGSIKQIYCR
jgi:hypothetical protein